jgi:pimeloyl-ACP methyl ester carboxylesterase
MPKANEAHTAGSRSGSTASQAKILQADIEHLSLLSQGLRFNVAVAGPVDGPLVIMLHGFPENWYAWRHQSGPLAAAGYRVAMPDQRGYGQSEKPVGRRHYQLGTLAEDVIGLAQALGHERFTVVGHDWGGVVAWQLATQHFAHLEGAVILNAPHPATLLRYGLKNPMQLLKSAYVGFFQLPLLPEFMLSVGNYQALVLGLTSTSRPDTFSPVDLDVYRQAWAQPSALTSMLNWYRALPLTRSLAERRISLPLRIIWGDRDSALEPGLAEEGLGWCDNGEVFHLPNAGHWLHHEDADRINELLLGFLRKGRQVARPASE